MKFEFRVGGYQVWLRPNTDYLQPYDRWAARAKDVASGHRWFAYSRWWVVCLWKLWRMVK